MMLIMLPKTRPWEKLILLKTKVSIIYGEKILLLSKDIFHQLQLTLNISDQSLSRMKIVPKENVMSSFPVVLMKKHHHPNQTQ